MANAFLVSLRAFLVFTLLFGVLYPLSVHLYAMIGFGNASKGSILYVNEQPVGSKWIGQYNHDARYFWPRPSATEPPYNASASASSNVSVTNPEYKKTVAARAQELKKAHPSFKDNIPADMVTASASGLDPHISPEAAQMQIARVAAARKLPVETVAKLVEAHTDDMQFSLLGRPRVNVLELNLALDHDNTSKH